MTPLGPAPRRRRFVAVTFALAFALSACGPRPPAQVALTILSTNDFHGGLESSAKDRDTNRPLGGAPFVKATLDRERATNPRATITLDAGDIYQGTALSNLTEGRSTIDYMNASGFDAAAVGNHEFDWGVPTLIDRIKQAQFPILVANMIERSTGKLPAWAQPYTIVEREGLRVAVIGLITVTTPSVTLPENVAPYEFLDPAEVANRLIAELVPSRADIAVIACHIGGTQNRDGQITGEVARMAEAIAGEAAVVSGHTHQRLAGEVDGVPVVQAVSSGRYIGRIDLLVDRATRRVVRDSVRVIPVFSDSIAPDAVVAAIVAEHREKIAPILDEVVGEAAAPITVERAECPMGDLVADVMREASRATFAFTNPGGLRAPIDSGPITYSEVYAVIPFDNTIVIEEMTGEEVIRLLEQAAEDGGFLHPSGLSFTQDMTRPPGSRITVAAMTGGFPIIGDTKYPVAVNDFMAQGGDGLSMLVDRPGAKESGIRLRDALLDYIRAETKAGRKIPARIDKRINRLQ